MGDGGDYEAVATDAIKDGIRSAADDELADAGFRSDSAEIGMNSQCLDDRNDASGQALGGVRLVRGYEGPNFLKASEGQRRPDDLERATFLAMFLAGGRSQHRERGRGGSSAWTLPQTHFGGGNSRSVPQESSQAFMSSCRM